MLTAAVRDLHKSHPLQFSTDVRTPYPELWSHNTWLTPLLETDQGVEIVDCHYPLIHRSRQRPFHFIHGFIQFLSERLNAKFEPHAFRGDIHLSPEERASRCPVSAFTGRRTPFWLVVAGGKFDFTIKWWEFARWQKVIDHFRGHIQFVQVGAADHFHPKLNGTIDFRGQTTLRQLITLVFHSQGVLCPVTCLMHLAAAVPLREGQGRLHLPQLRPCVVVAGGREPAHWEEYPGHQFIHTIGALPCCARGGCWRSRTVPLGDGDPKDRHLCVDVVKGLPRCMDMITPEEVIRRIELYFQGGACRYLNEERLTLAMPNAVTGDL